MGIFDIFKRKKAPTIISETTKEEEMQQIHDRVQRNIDSGKLKIIEEKKRWSDYLLSVFTTVRSDLNNYFTSNRTPLSTETIGALDDLIIKMQNKGNGLLDLDYYFDLILKNLEIMIERSENDTSTLERVKGRLINLREELGKASE